MSQKPAPLVIKEHVKEEWRLEGSLVVLSLTSLSRQYVDQFVESVIRILNAWPEDKPIRILYDMRQVGASTYLRQRSEYAAKHTPDRLGRAAFLMQKTIIHRVMEITINRHILVKSKKYLERRVFFDEASALAWVQGEIPIPKPD